MNLSNSVTKLGKGCHSVSREVGPTCPGNCPFLCGILPDGTTMPKKSRCYARRLQRMRPTVLAAWAKQNDEMPEDLNVALLRQNVRALRLHVGGDFGKGNALDAHYIRSVTKQLWIARLHGWSGAVWTYTHFWRELAAAPELWDGLKRAGVTVYASVHTCEEAEEARALGFLVALDNPAPTKKSGFHEVHGVRALACPEQVKGSKAVTCDKCGWCVKGKGDVAFYRH